MLYKALKGLIRPWKALCTPPLAFPWTAWNSSGRRCQDHYLILQRSACLDRTVFVTSLRSAKRGHARSKLLLQLLRLRWVDELIVTRLVVPVLTHRLLNVWSWCPGGDFYIFTMLCLTKWLRWTDHGWMGEQLMDGCMGEQIMDVCMDGWLHGWTDHGCMDGWMRGWMDGCTRGCMRGCIDGMRAWWMDGWMNAWWMNGRVNAWWMDECMLLKPWEAEAL